MSDQNIAGLSAAQGPVHASDVGRSEASAASPASVDDVARFLRRRAWLILGLPLLVALFSVAMSRPRPTTYQAHLAFAIDIPRSAIVIGSDEGTAAKIGEALVDDLSRMIGGDVFAAAVSKWLPAGITVDAGEIASSLSATDRHRIADVTVTRVLAARATGAEAEALRSELLAIARGVVSELDTNGGTWFARLGEDKVSLTVVDTPNVTVLAPSLRDRLELPLRVALAFVLALGLAALIESIDTRMRAESTAVADAAAPVVGRIPRRRRDWRLPR